MIEYLPAVFFTAIGTVLAAGLTNTATRILGWIVLVIACVAVYAAWRETNPPGWDNEYPD